VRDDGDRRAPEHGEWYLGRLTDFVALDQSGPRLRGAWRRVPRAAVLCVDALALPAPIDSFDRGFTSHSYGCLVHVDRGSR
jgi:hypothetical protein